MGFLCHDPAILFTYSWGRHVLQLEEMIHRKNTRQQFKLAQNKRHANETNKQTKKKQSNKRQKLSIVFSNRMKIRFSTALKRLGPLLRVIQACFSALVPENLIHNFTVPKLLQVLWTTISPPALLIEGALVVEDLLVLLLFRFLKRLGKAQA